MGKSSTKRYQSQISSETDLKYGPQLEGLALLLSQAQSDRNQGLAVNASTARGLSDAARLARPDVQKANDSYLAQLLQAKGTVGQDTAGLSAAADPFRASSARDFANAQIRAAETTKASGDELTQRGIDAQAGAAAGARAIGDRYAQQAEQIGQQQQSVTGQAGSFAASRLAELLGDAQKQAHETAQKSADRKTSTANTDSRNATSLTVAGVNPDGTIIPGGPKDPAVKDKGKPKKWATPQQTGSFKDKIEQQRAWIRAHKGMYKSRADMARDLSTGVPGTSQTDMDPKSPTYGQTLPDPGVPKASSQLALSVALDLEYDQHVSGRNVGELHKRRYRVKDLGLPTRAPAKKRPAATAPATAGLPVGPLAPVTVG